MEEIALGLMCDIGMIPEEEQVRVGCGVARTRQQKRAKMLKDAAEAVESCFAHLACICQVQGCTLAVHQAVRRSAESSVHRFCQAGENVEFGNEINTFRFSDLEN